MDRVYKLLEERKNLNNEFGNKDIRDYLKENAKLIDRYFIDCFNIHSSDCLEYATAAMGGYGREEQFRYSDVDVLFIFKKKGGSKEPEVVRKTIYPLWDIGLEVGYCIHGINDFIKLALSDFNMLISFLDSRFVCGNQSIYNLLWKRITKKLKSSRLKDIIQWLIKTSEARRIHFGDSAYLLEPNLKEGKGGLRDYHFMLWFARLESGAKSLNDLKSYGYIDAKIAASMHDALEFIWNTRACLHDLAGRKSDRLMFEYQIKTAQMMDFKEQDKQRQVENFLSALHSKMEFIKKQYQIFIDKKTHTKSIPAKNPLSIYQKALKEFIDAKDDAKAADAFEKILLAKEPIADILNSMLGTGLLQKFIPEIEGITNKIQYDEYHLYPVDRHSVYTLIEIKKFAYQDKNRLFKELMQEIDDITPLLWAGLLHDIGKCRGASDHGKTGAKIAESILIKKSRNKKTVKDVSFLVENHLFLIETATRRDIKDEETAIFCAKKIKSPKLLKMLYLLTVADSKATGPKALGQWKLALLEELFFYILKIIENKELATGRAIETVKKKKELIFSKAGQSKEKLIEIFEFMTPRYLLYTEAEAIQQHIKLYEKLKTEKFCIKPETDHHSETRTVTICAKRSPSIFSMIAGVFAINAIEILDAEIYTWKNNISIAILKVKAPPDPIFEHEKWERVKKNMGEVIDGKLNIKEQLKQESKKCSKIFREPDRVSIDNTSSGFFTIVEVFTYDSPGLLFRITDALLSCGLDVRIAKITTKADQAADIFYVRDFDGQVVTSNQQIEIIKAKVMEVLIEK